MSVDIAYRFGCPCVPAFVPFRALTNEKVKNLVVAGLAMAQSYMVNSALRMHPIEWSTGTSAGVVAAFMAKNKLAATGDVEGRMDELQVVLRKHTPLEWTIDGKIWPQELAVDPVSQSVPAKTDGTTAQS